MKTDDYLLGQHFLQRCFSRPFLLLMFGCLTAGIAVGTIAVKLLHLSDDQTLLPLFLSAVPTVNLGFFQCFSDVLLNIMILLIATFLMGATAFGALGIPLLMFYRGVTVAVGALFLVGDGDISALGYSALCFTPIWAVASFLTALFAVRALIFSKGLARAGFSQSQETVDFRLFLKYFIYFLCFSVPVSVAGGLLAMLYVVL